MTFWHFSEIELEAIRLSVIVAVWAVVISLPCGLALAWLLARKEFRGKAVVETIANLPLVLPPVVTGQLLLFSLGRKGWLGQYLDAWFDVQIVFTWKAAAVASAVMAFPLMLRAMRLAIGSVDTRLEQMSRTLGAGRIETFVRITLPLAKHGVIAGCVLAFARSMGEFGATIMIAGNIPGETRTIPLQIFTLMSAPGGEEQTWRLVIASIIVSAGALALGEYLQRRGRTRLSAQRTQ